LMGSDGVAFECFGGRDVSPASHALMPFIPLPFI
jgi:hypothetical protein